MAGRYTSWYHKRFPDGTPAWLVKVGEKILGRVADRQTRSGMGTVDETVRLEDGSMIRATILGQQPILELVWSGAGESDACTIYMESGVVDLGPATAANQYTPPSFGSEDKQLHFHSMMGCDDLGGLNGEAYYTEDTISSQCLENAEAPVYSRAFTSVDTSR